MYRYIIVLACMGIALIGCAEKHVYVEQQTPPGQIAPPSVSTRPLTAADSGTPYRNPNESQYGGYSQKSQAKIETSLTEPPAQNAKPLMTPSIISEFRQSYRRAGTPRMAIYLNRELSDEVREWQTMVSSVYSARVTPYGIRERQITSRIEGNIEDEKRPSAQESWMWLFEDGFVQAFLEANAKLVDRTVIMRLKAAEKQGDDYRSMAVRKVEMEALKGKADVLVEILVQINPNTQLGYVFKASAKSVNTGQILANATSVNWEYKTDDGYEEKVVATNTGYDFVKQKRVVKLPEVNLVSRDLALALMLSLSKNLQN